MTPVISDKFQVASFYELKPLAELEQFATFLKTLAEAEAVKGLIILSPEGINGTIAGMQLEEFLTQVAGRVGVSSFDVKRSYSEKAPFKRFAVRIRPEIVTSDFETKDEAIKGEGFKHTLTPEEWDQILKSGEEINLVDTRNDYELKLGRFKGAIDPQIEEFSYLKGFIQKAELPKDRKTLLYCTGGIRCEKAIFEFKQAGYENVYQLGGGILRYLEKFPNQEFEGECFVFDHRVAVDQNLEPSKRFRFCEHCGDPTEAGDRSDCSCLANAAKLNQSVGL